MNNELVRYDQAKQAIAAYKSVDEVKDYRDKALAIQAYAKQANDFDLERDAAVARLRAERRCGELLKGMEKFRGSIDATLRKKNGKDKFSEFTKTCKNSGIKRVQAWTWQKLASLPEHAFDETIKDELDKNRSISATCILNAIKRKEFSVPRSRPKTRGLPSEQPHIDVAVKNLSYSIKHNPDKVDNALKSLRAAAALSIYTYTSRDNHGIVRELVEIIAGLLSKPH